MSQTQFRDPDHKPLSGRFRLVFFVKNAEPILAQVVNRTIARQNTAPDPNNEKAMNNEEYSNSK